VPEDRVPDETYAERLNVHYGALNLAERIRAALHAAGIGDTPTVDDLAPLDQFHTGGRRATHDLAALAGLRAAQSVLDVGGGIGGPARTLASLYGCAVTVLDLTAAFCEAGAALTAITELGDRVSFHHGDALAMPFVDGSFDVVWTQHATMNVEDKACLYAEAYRVLRPGGRLVFHEVMAGSVQPVHFPVPWARDPALSFLRPAAEVRSLLRRTGFVEVVWEDVTAWSRDWIRARNERVAAAAPSPLGIHLLLGADSRAMSANSLRNLEEGRVTIVRAIFDRP
jgi:ubiquinone/menaquinone biosynthesis C-methylase UbiE